MYAIDVQGGCSVQDSPGGTREDRRSAIGNAPESEQALKKSQRKDQDPKACSEELHGPLKDYRRFHLLGYRIIYRVFPQLKALAIVGIGTHSKDAKADTYRRLEVPAEKGKIAESVFHSLKGFSAGTLGKPNI